MPAYWSRTLIPTARQAPADAEVPSHQLMLRAGYLRRLGSGLYDYLPLGVRSLHKAMAIIREEMSAAGAIEVFLPALQPIELWEQTGRRAAYGENLFVVKDRHGREQALGPTHEEVMTELVRGYVDSYRQLPITLYQIQTKFRDEFRPRFGVLRSREFQMKDAYSFDLTLDALDKSYQAMYDAYCRIFSRSGLPYEIVEAESGPIGGSASHEFMVPSPTGEDTILKSDKGNYAANVEKCETGERKEDILGEPTGELTKVHTPNCQRIEDVAKLLTTKPRHILKTLVYKVVSPVGAAERKKIGSPRDAAWILVVVRGDHEVNEAKLRRIVDVDIELATDNDARAAGFAIGYVGPLAAAKRNDVALIGDIDALQSQFWVAGANEHGYHVKHFSWKRDYFGAIAERIGKKAIAAIQGAPGTGLDQENDSKLTAQVLDGGDIRNAVDGDPSPRNDGGTLVETKGIEIGHVFKLGTKYTDAMDFKVLDENNERRPVIMGCYGIGVNRILAAAIERMEPGKEGHDANGIIWPASLAPYQVIITPIKYDGDVKRVADELAAQLESLPGGIDVLIDDRDERPGVKFKDADLIGIPLRITIGDKALKDGQVEIKPRRAEKADLVAVDQAAQRAAELLAEL